MVIAMPQKGLEERGSHFEEPEQTGWDTIATTIASCRIYPVPNRYGSPIDIPGSGIPRKPQTLTLGPNRAT